MAGNEAHDSIVERFWRRVAKRDSGCWEWTGHVSGGYGRIRVGSGKREQAHRVALEVVAGRRIPEGLQVDHLCRNQRCVNPEHLKPVTPKENTHRGMAPSAVALRTGLCLKGHPLEGDNVRTRANGKRECKACALDAQRAHRAANRDEINARKRAAYARNPEPAKAAARRRYALAVGGE